MGKFLGYFKNLKVSDVLQNLAQLAVLYGLLSGCKYLLTGDASMRRTELLLVIAAVVVVCKKLFKNQALYYGLAIAVTTALSSPLLIKVAVGESLLPEVTIKFIGFNFALAGGGLVLGKIISRCRFGWLANFVLLALLFVPALIFWCYYLTSGALFGVDTLLAIMQTNVSESREFLADNYNAASIILLAVTLSALLLLARNLHRLTLRWQGRSLKIAVAVFLLCDAALLYKCKGNMLTHLVKNTKTYFAKYEDFNKYQAARKKNVQKLVSMAAGDKGMYVLVIGESQNKLHMQAYGYHRPTTPWLAEIKNNPDFLLFNDVYSCHTHTVPTLVYALTAKNQYNTLKLENAASLLEVAEAAGYDTAWLSNQVQYSAWDTPITVIASEANQQIWINKSVGETTTTNFYDGKLAETLDKIKLSDKMLIVIHLMGNHGAYAERYPSEFNRFTGRKTVDYYDNSILYNDYVMEQIYKKVQSLPNFKAMMYFSDHSEAVDEGLSHDSGRFVPNMTKIPMYMYLSDSFKAQRPEAFANLAAARSKPVTNDLVFNTMLGLMNIRLGGVYEAGNDITGSNYNADSDRFKTLYGKKSIAKEVEQTK